MAHVIEDIESLKFSDIVILAILCDNKNRTVGQKEFVDLLSSDGGLYNQFIDQHNIPVSHASKHRSVDKFLKSIKRLRLSGLVTNHQYQITENGIKLMDELGHFPKYWPLEIPVDANGNVYSDRKIDTTHFRGNLELNVVKKK